MKKYILITAIALVGGYGGAYIFNLQHQVNTQSVISSNTNIVEETSEKDESQQNVSNYDDMIVRQSIGGVMEVEDFVLICDSEDGPRSDS